MPQAADSSDRSLGESTTAAGGRREAKVAALRAPVRRRPLTGSPSLLRRMNIAAILDTVRVHGPVSRRDIARATGLSRPTIDEVLMLLLRGGYVEEKVDEHDGDARRRPGPRARLLTFRANLGHVIGIDVGGSTVRVLVSDLSGSIVANARGTLDAATKASPSAVRDELEHRVNEALAGAGVSMDSINAIGVGTPGVIDPSSGRITLAPQLPNWEGLQLEALLATFLPRPIVVENEVRLSLLAERWRGAARYFDDALYIQVGYCIGAAILMGGEIYRGAVGAAGEIGYLPLFIDEARPSDGRGTFEFGASGDAFARRGRELAMSARGASLRQAVGGDLGAIDAELIFARAGDGDEVAAGLVDELVHRLALGVAAGVALLNPEVVVIGGGVSRAGAALLERLRSELHGLVPVQSRLVLSELGDEAAVLGAVRAAIDSVEESMFGFFGSDADVAVLR
jgi:predicted NBD/HSP70 family sugar kinase